MCFRYAVIMFFLSINTVVRLIGFIKGLVEELIFGYKESPKSYRVGLRAFVYALLSLAGQQCKSICALYDM